MAIRTHPSGHQTDDYEPGRPVGYATTDELAARQRDEAERRSRERQRADAEQPRPSGGRQSEPLSFPERPRWVVVGSREVTAVLDLLRLQLNRHARGLPKARARRVEAAVAELESALGGDRTKAS